MLISCGGGGGGSSSSDNSRRSRKNRSRQQRQRSCCDEERESKIISNTRIITTNTCPAATSTTTTLPDLVVNKTTTTTTTTTTTNTNTKSTRKELFKLKLNANEWEYVAEGGANVIFRPIIIKGKRRRNRSKSFSVSSSDDNNTDDNDDNNTDDAIDIDDCVLRVPKSSQLLKHNYVDILDYISNSILPIMNENNNNNVNNNNNNSNVDTKNYDEVMDDDDDDCNQEEEEEEEEEEDDPAKNNNKFSKYRLYGNLVSSSSSTFLKELNDKLQSTNRRPIHRRGSTLANTDTNTTDTNTRMMILPNVIKNNYGTQEHDQNHQNQQICTIEIKPKSSVQPTTTYENTIISNYGFMKQRTCRYCMHQEYKISTTNEKRRPTKLSYCPIDLFSSNKSRMKKAIRSLIETPQNNLKCFLPSDNNDNDNDNKDSTTTTAKEEEEVMTTTTTDNINKIINNQDNTIQNKNDFIHIIVETLVESNVLNDIKQIQELGNSLDIEGIYELQQLMDELTTNMHLNNDSSVIPKEYLLSSSTSSSFGGVRRQRPDADADIDDSTNNHDSTTTANSSSNENNDDSQQHQHQQKNQIFCYHRRLLLLKAIGCNVETSTTIPEIRQQFQQALDNFLLATTMKDCSILLSIRQQATSESDNDDGNGTGNENGNEDGEGEGEGEGDGQCIDDKVEQQTENQNVDDDDNNNDWRHDMEYRIECPDNNNNKQAVVYYVLVSIIDLDMKSSSKLPKYYTLDQQIVNHYSTMYGLHHKLCFGFDSDYGEEGQKKDEKERSLLHRLDEVVQIKGNMMCRLLYPNPVCLLTVYDPQSIESISSTATNNHHHRHHLMNVMTITWLTTIDNSGLFVCSINKKRYTAELLNVSSVFVLNVPTRDMEDTILRIGSCSGRDVDKFQKFGLQICCPGWSSSSSLRHEHDEKKRKTIKNAIALSDCIAHIVCTVQSKQDQGQHWLLVCKQEFSWCRKAYFEDGKRFRRNSDSLPPYLTFLGSQTFGSVV